MSGNFNNNGFSSENQNKESGKESEGKFISPLECEDNCSEDNDNIQEGDEEKSEQNRRLATFSLSMSDVESNYVSDDDHSLSTADPEEMEEPTESDRKMWKRQRDLRLSLILGISADEKCEKQLAMQHAEDDRLLLDFEQVGIVRPCKAEDYESDLNAQGSTTVEPTTFHEDCEFDYLRSASMRRSSSLKTNKTPPGTPSRKKVVRFADALGLDLANIRHIMNFDEPPIVPISAMQDLNLQNRPNAAPALVQVRHLCTCFSQPGCSPDFIRRVIERKVSLETCAIDDRNLTVSGIVRVANIAYQKGVIVRYTVNGWMTYTDDTASYVSGSNDGVTDRFMFTIHLPDYFAFGSRLEFSIMFTSGDQTFWDSNFGSNYRVECYFNMEPSLEAETIKGGCFY